MALIKQAPKINTRLTSVGQYDQTEVRYRRLAVHAIKDESTLGSAIVFSEPSQSGFESVAFNVHDLLDALKEIGYVDANLGKHISATGGSMISQATIQAKIEELEREAAKLYEQSRRPRPGDRDGGHAEHDAAMNRKYAAHVLRELRDEPSARS